ncbi:hypothetical protein TVAG_391260 [Trichomonas vaginalis G3]|uniref:Uncharacterized protein n=1 Tax=Trichomonas vaginalis (strain ATCC PRA-98 / G3) TaxID=412133 RepID=A2DFN9_TRIV3|nr:protein ubiquitination [Trichomonas vaginalis G3]EAY20742.1 hypothetical protein TVAG_391260 [Trichomonas vaginalis G3]KAI5529483.1 protein ubiquitination [Trichomonas vaginalis G3]|eukprot:XP_001581728.1 hypothetical protein [Trichomonas vaginalis G3]
MKLQILDSIIDILDHVQNDISNSTNKSEKPQSDFNQVPKEIVKENTEQEMQSIKSPIQENQENEFPIEFLDKISKLKNSYFTYEIYKFFDEISEKGNQKMMLKAIEEGLHEKIFDWGNVLHHASEKGNLRLVKSLIECGCDKEAEGIWGYTPLLYASWKGHLEVAKYLISIGANIEAKEDKGETPLYIASENGHAEVVKYLISVGANKEIKNQFGYTPLIVASINGHLEVVKCLVSAGANKNAKDRDGDTPLIHASMGDHLRVFKYLISAGADKTARNNNRQTANLVAGRNVRDYLVIEQFKRNHVNF